MQRSPNYPAIDLGRAIAAARLLYKSEGRTAVPQEILAKAMGYRSLSGPARTGISALRKYGLISENKGLFRISDLGLLILVNDVDSADFRVAAKSAALTPELFKQLYKSHLEGSIGAIKQHLILTRSFTEDGARLAATVFKRTIEFAKLDSGEYSSPGASGELTQNQGVASGGDMPEPTVGPGPEPRSLAGSLVLSMPLAQDMRAEVRFSGRDLRPAHFARLISYLNLAKDAITQEGAGDDDGDAS